MDMIRALCYQLATRRNPIGFARINNKISLVIVKKRYLDSTENILKLLKKEATRGKN